MALANWMPDLDAVERVASDLALRYGASVAIRYRRVMFSPPSSFGSGRKPALEFQVRSASDLLPGQREIICRLWERGQSPRQIAREWGLRVAWVREVLESVVSA